MGLCVFFDDDFLMPYTLASATAQGPFYTYQDSAVTIKGKAINDTDIELGVLDIDVLDTDNDEGSIQFGTQNQWRLDNTAGNTSKVGYEVRLRVDELAANETAIMVGFVEGPLVTAVAVDDTGALKSSISFVGFITYPSAPTTLQIGYQDTGTAGITIINNAAGTLVENTYVKLGMLFDPYSRDSNKAMTFFVDGVAVDSATLAEVNASTFPEAEGMVPFVLGKTYGSGTSGTVSIDRATAFMYRNAVQG
ncbi:MAG TPA: hypothetical protein VMX74_01810 [Pirellulales bacterium]|nr:hypothetical protein [Pirellulales bacterium]